MGGDKKNGKEMVPPWQFFLELPPILFLFLNGRVSSLQSQYGGGRGALTYSPNLGMGNNDAFIFWSPASTGSMGSGHEALPDAQHPHLHPRIQLKQTGPSALQGLLRSCLGLSEGDRAETQ